MFEKGILPIILFIISAALGGFLKDAFDPTKPVVVWKKNTANGLIILAVLGLVSWVVWSTRPASPPDLNSTATALVSTSTKISAQIDGTRSAATSTAVANATLIVVGNQESIQHMTATQSAKLININQKVSDNAGLCDYATNEIAFEKDIDLYNIISLISVFFWILVVGSFVLAVVEVERRKIFILLFSASLVIAVLLIVFIASHPFFDLPNGPTTVSDEGYRQAILQECDDYMQQPIRATQTQVAAQAQIQTQAVYLTQTQSAILLQSKNAATQAAAATLVTNQTATQQAFENWMNEHRFIDEFSLDHHGWTGNDKASEVKLDRNQGLLSYTSIKDEENRPSFWKCDLCEIPNTHKNYSFEFKYRVPENQQEFNFGFLFGCTKFDEELVSCQGIQIIGQSQFIILHVGPKEEYDSVSHDLQPNAKGFMNILLEVRDQRLSLVVNDQTLVNNIEIDGDADGMFGLYADPAGSTVFIDRIEINPLP
jgi:hypothetical protein